MPAPLLARARKAAKKDARTLSGWLVTILEQKLKR
jgi:hypothetical protein